MKFGISILANDAVSDWLTALLESIKCHCPELPVSVIPFNERLQGVASLQETYDFEILRVEMLNNLDRIGSKFFPESHLKHHFRKLAAFEGPFDCFLCLDADTLILTHPFPLLEAFAASSYDFLCFDTDLDQVYWPGPFRERMVREFHSIGFNTGTFASRKGALGLADFVGLSSSSDLDPNELTRNLEQGFLNYCIDVRSVRTCRVGEVAVEYAGSVWARHPIVREGAAYLLAHPRHPDRGKQLPILHWAGIHKVSGDMPNVEIHEHYRYGRWREGT